MAEYIEREALIREALKNKAICGCCADIVDLRGIVSSIPAADVRPEKHGEWITRHEGLPFCSACSYNGFGHMMPPYCPQCGAKMDGKDVT